MPSCPCGRPSRSTAIWTPNPTSPPPSPTSRANLRELGQHDEALATTREAVRRYRGLIAVDPDRYGGDLARALTDFGTDLRHACAPDDALTASRESVQRCRDLAAAAPARHLPDLAVALTGLGADLREVRGARRGARRQPGGGPALPGRDGQQRRAPPPRPGPRPHRPRRRPADSLAVTTKPSWPAARPSALPGACRRRPHHLPDLARGLTVLGASLRETGAYRAGIAASHDAVRLYRELAAADPDATPPTSPAPSPSSASACGAGTLRRRPDPRMGGRPDLTRELAADDPDRHTPDLARALTRSRSSACAGSPRTRRPSS